MQLHKLHMFSQMQTSVDLLMENLSQKEQIHEMHTSTIVIGMHGAGMANIGFMRSKSYVIEIFPKTKRRWGYRNMCQYLDIHYEDYRGGTDGLRNSKIIPTAWIQYLRAALDFRYIVFAIFCGCMRGVHIPKIGTTIQI